MCGICCLIHMKTHHCKYEIGYSQSTSADSHCKNYENYEQIQRLLERRGPDGSQSIASYFPDDDDALCMLMHSTVLCLRGNSLCLQPHQLPNGDVLLWNGEIFGGLQVQHGESDTEFLANQLSKVNTPKDVIHILESVHGPWAIVFWQKSQKRLWFGRDVLGRRSLLWLKQAPSCVAFGLASVALSDSQDDWEEVPADGIYCLELANKKCLKVMKYPWSKMISGLENAGDCRDTCEIPDLVLNCRLCISKDIQPLTPVLHPLNRDLPSESQNQLWTEIKSVKEKQCENGLSNVSNSDCSDMDAKTSLKSVSVIFEPLLGIQTLHSLLTQFEDVLSEAVKLRVLMHQQVCKECFHRFSFKKNQCVHSSIAVLFSGGLDSAVIALLADRFVPASVPIDLLNVSFCHETQKARKNYHRKKGVSSEEIEMSYEGPDRITGRQTLEELKCLCPDRKWNFVTVDVTKEELQELRQKHVKYLVYPCESVLDDSIGCAAWFAARGYSPESDYTSPARVILVGMGADEQLGGYSRHRAKFSAEGWNGLVEEIALEIDRISWRNLGRDDRIISDHGREARFPYLDENVVSFLNSLPIWVKAHLELPRGVGEKLLLRLLCWKLGLKLASVLRKRAIQFGSRIAKLESSKEKGNEKCHRLSSFS